jgi:hypothetical protein
MNKTGGLRDRIEAEFKDMLANTILKCMVIGPQINERDHDFSLIEDSSLSVPCAPALEVIDFVDGTQIEKRKKLNRFERPDWRRISRLCRCFR